MFVDALAGFIVWKVAKGFDVFVKTAEEIEAAYAGSELRYKIRGCIRGYHLRLGPLSRRNTLYVLLVGDSVPVAYPEPAGGSPPATLSEAWNLPAGYYRWDFWDASQQSWRIQTQYTTLFYADFSDKEHYVAGENCYAGDYRAYVGVMPVRTVAELEAVLRKTMECPAASGLTFVYSADYYDPTYAEVTRQQIESIAAGLSTAHCLFDAASNPDSVYEALCGSPGIVYASAHGLMTPGSGSQLPGFRIGGVWVTRNDATKCEYVNPLYIINACWADAYAYGEPIDESWLKARRGPASMISKVPIRYPVPPGGGLSQTELGFWRDLFQHKTLGAAFYNNCFGAYADPLHLFGDPTLVVVPALEGRPFSWSRLVESIAWVWTVLVGVLLITPGGTWCISCRVPVPEPGYVGELATLSLGAGSIAIGIAGIAHALWPIVRRWAHLGQADKSHR